MRTRLRFWATGRGRKASVRPLLQPELLLRSEVFLVAGSDALSTLRLLAHLFSFLTFSARFPFVVCSGGWFVFGFFPPKLWDGWLPHSLALVAEITDCLFHKASRANRAASAGAARAAGAGEERRKVEGDRQKPAGIFLCAFEIISCFHTPGGQPSLKTACDLNGIT